MKKWIFRGLALALLVTFFYFLFACGKKKVETKLVEAVRGDIREKALAVGTIEPEKDSLRFYYLGANWKRRVEHVGAKPSIDQEGPLVF